MSHSVRKFVAVLLALWLPLFSGSAMAASVSMQLDMGSSHHPSNGMSDDAMMDMSHGDSCEMSAASGDLDGHAATPDHPHHKCSACGICQLACSGYLAMSALNGLSVQQSASTPSGYLLSFVSVTSLPLLPPPLVLI